MVETLPTGSASLEVDLRSEAYPLTLRWHLQQPVPALLTVADARTGRPLPQVLSSAGGTVLIQNPSITKILLKIEISNSVPRDFSLKQNYPNPFNPTTTIEFTLPSPSSVTLRVFNILGQQVSTLIDNVRYSSGDHGVSFSGADLGSGVYFYELVAAGLEQRPFRQVKKMLLLK